MTTEQIACRLAELCRQGLFETAQKGLFAENAVSVEPEATSDFPTETKGLRAIIEKGHTFESMVEKYMAAAPPRRWPPATPLPSLGQWMSR
jgi:hypothetical protein